MQTLSKKLFRDMQEHPEKYSDQEIEAMMDDLDQMPDVDTAWQEFNHQHTAIRTPRRWLQIAALFAGVVFFSGIAFAAIQLLTLTPDPSPKGEGSENIQVSDSLPRPLQRERSDEAVPVTFDNVPLDKMITQIAKHYQAEAVFQSEETSRLRFYFVWYKEQPLEKVVETLNRFEHIDIVIEDNKLIVR